MKEREPPLPSFDALLSTSSAQTIESEAHAPDSPNRREAPTVLK
ncbi:MAG TPA: hypothetical protein VGB73_04180 [Pyrinomonadaceae bacterium]|jgi:hypothetical protein